MKKQRSRLFLFSTCMMVGSTIAGISTATQAAELTSPTTDLLSSSTSAPNIDRVLSELSRQHDNASSLVKEARQPVSLAVQSPLLAKDTSTISNDEDVLERLTAVASNSVSKFKQTGLASWYGRKFHGRKTASGETFNMNAMTAAHRSLPLNCYVKVTNKSNGKSVVVKVNDRGPFHGNRVLDLSYGAAKQIGLAQSGTGNVTIERVSGP
ncbi:septal ring lytic transglycosylase RlpA family protein [Psychrobacter sp. I-STPA10]|uniref:septal ring lytic transglycosylase RlpA family protein n=1 Tax=Psychrobacter sp. I-STPA10 TaxID=2585769 RepID=UPI001E576B21|nr:septal ring lytic transglycosylase RlpA family protein [Psychrobacter sp. I-STPA10]